MIFLFHKYLEHSSFLFCKFRFIFCLNNSCFSFPIMWQDFHILVRCYHCNVSQVLLVISATSCEAEVPTAEEFILQQIVNEIFLPTSSYLE